MGVLAVAIERQRWDLASLCLLWGVTYAAAALPPDAIEGLIEALEAGAEPGPASRQRPGRGRGGGR